MRVWWVGPLAVMPHPQEGSSTKEEWPRVIVFPLAGGRNDDAKKQEKKRMKEAAITALADIVLASDTFSVSNDLSVSLPSFFLQGCRPGLRGGGGGCCRCQGINGSYDSPSPSKQQCH